MLKYAPLLANLPFFSDRRIKAQGIAEIINLWQFKTVPKHQFVFEYGSLSNEFFFILDGEVEVLLPNKTHSEEYKSVIGEINFIKDNLLQMKKEVNNFLEMKEDIKLKREKDKIKEKSNLLFKIERRFTRVLDQEIPQ